jgi:VWFA-related protein
MRSVATLVSVLLVLGAAPLVSAQATLPPVQTEAVELDVVVTDKEGKLVKSLTRDDFELREDGKPQRLTQFHLTERSSAGPRGPEASPSGPPPADRPAAAGAGAAGATGEGRHVVLLVDDLHIAPGNLQYTKQALARFVDEFAAPEDDVALITTGSSGGYPQLTRDRGVIKEAIGRLDVRQASVAPARSSQMTPAQAEMILRGDNAAIRLAARTMMEEPGSVYAGTLGGPQGALAASGGGVSAGIDPSEAAPAAEAKRQARGILLEALRFSAVTLERLDDVVRGLAGLHGRKICLMVSDGFLVGLGTSEELTRDLRGVIDAATRSGTVVYTLDTRGLVSTVTEAGTGPTTSQPGLSDTVQRQSELLLRTTLKGVADDTGGFLISGTNDLAGGLRRMLGDNDAYYLMGYEPTNTKHDGKFRKIEVRLPRHADLVVRTRKGYLAPDDRKEARKVEPTVASRTVPSASAPFALGEEEVRAVLSAPPPPNGIKVRMTADYLDLPPAGPQTAVRAQVDLSGLKWQEVAGRQQAALDLIGGVFDATGNPVGKPFGRHTDLDLSPAEYKRVSEAGLQFQQQLALGPGRYEIRLYAREAKVGQLGGTSQWVDIPNLADKKLAMSSIFLSAAAPVANAPSTGAGENETLLDVQTLRRFKRDQALFFQLYVYNPVLDDKGANDVVYQAQIWTGGKTVAASKAQPAAFGKKNDAPLPETNGLPLEGLPPGAYELRVVVVDRKANATIYKKVDFTIE